MRLETYLPCLHPSAQSCRVSPYLTIAIGYSLGQFTPSTRSCCISEAVLPCDSKLTGSESLSPLKAAMSTRLFSNAIRSLPSPNHSLHSKLLNQQSCCHQAIRNLSGPSSLPFVTKGRAFGYFVVCAVANDGYHLETFGSSIGQGL